MRQLLTSRQVQQALDRLYESVVRQLPTNTRIAVIGIRTRGESLARRLVERLRADHPELTIDIGVLDITFYRDDLAQRQGAPLVRATEIGFDVNGCWLLLVDDVLQTGRSVRAALDAVHDFGRPKVVRLAVLIDRGGREVPIAADFVGRRLRAGGTELIQVKLQETDGKEGAFIVKKES